MGNLFRVLNLLLIMTTFSQSVRAFAFDSSDAGVAAAADAAAAAVDGFSDAATSMDAVIGEADLGMVGPDTLANAEEAVNQAAMHATIAMMELAETVGKNLGMTISEMQAVIDAQAKALTEQMEDMGVSMEASDLPNELSNSLLGGGSHLGNSLAYLRYLRGKSYKPIQLVKPPGTPHAPVTCSVKTKHIGRPIATVKLGKSRTFFASEYNARTCAWQTRKCTLVNGVPTLSGSFLYTRCYTGRLR